MAGILTKGITLSYKAAEAADYTVLTNLQEIPSIGNASPRSRVDVTTLDDDTMQSIAGLQEEAESDLAFKFLYEKTQFETLMAITEKTDWRVSMPNGVYADFVGIPAVAFDGAGVNAAVTYTLNISVEGEFEFGSAA